MATNREQIEHIDHYLKMAKFNEDKPWKSYSHSRKWLKRQMNKYIRRTLKYIKEDEQGFKQKRKPYCGYEY